MFSEILYAQQPKEENSSNNGQIKLTIHTVKTSFQFKY